MCMPLHTVLAATPSPKNGSNTSGKSLPKRPQNGPKSVPNRPQIAPRSASERTSLPTSILDRFGTVFGPFWARSWRPLGGQVGVKLVQKSIFGGPGWRSKTNMMLDTFLNRFLVGFGTILEPKINPQSVQNRSQERS